MHYRHGIAGGGGGAGHLTGTSPNRPSLSVARTVGCPALDSEPHKPPQTYGAVTLPLHAHTPEALFRKRGGGVFWL